MAEVKDIYAWSARVAEHFGHVNELSALSDFFKGGAGGTCPPALDSFIKERKRKHRRELDEICAGIKKMARVGGAQDLVRLTEQLQARLHGDV